MIGWLKLHRSMLKWEWYGDLPCRVLFMHLLLIANHEDERWQGIVVKAGQRVTSLEKLAKETGLSLQSVRTAIAKLKSTGELTDESTSKYRIITVGKWAEYQGQQQAINKQATGEQQQSKKLRTNSVSKDTSLEIATREFPNFWKVYPFKKGSRAEAEKLYHNAIKSGVPYELLNGRADAYGRYIQATRTERRFTKNATTFLGRERHWETDWDEAREQSENDSRKPASPLRASGKQSYTDAGKELAAHYAALADAEDAAALQREGQARIIAPVEPDSGDAESLRKANGGPASASGGILLPVGSFHDGRNQNSHENLHAEPRGHPITVEHSTDHRPEFSTLIASHVREPLPEAKTGESLQPDGVREALH